LSDSVNFRLNGNENTVAGDARLYGVLQPGQSSLERMAGRHVQTSTVELTTYFLFSSFNFWFLMYKRYSFLLKKPDKIFGKKT